LSVNVIRSPWACPGPAAIAPCFVPRRLAPGSLAEARADAVAARDDARDAHPRARELLRDEHVLEDAEPEAAVLRRDQEPEVPPGDLPHAHPGGCGRDLRPAGLRPAATAARAHARQAPGGGTRGLSPAAHGLRGDGGLHHPPG